MSETQTLRERLNELLANAEASLESLPADGADEELAAALSDDGAAADLRETADEAGELLAEADSQEVLEAVGLAELSDGSDAPTIPAAIARGDETQVAELRALAKLAKLSNRWEEMDAAGDGEADDGLAAEVREVRETFANRSGALEATDESATDESATDADAGEREEDGAERAESPDEGADEETDDVEERLRSAMEVAVGGFGDEVRQARDRLQQLRDEDAEAADEEPASGEETDEEEPVAEDETDEEKTAAEEEADEEESTAEEDADAGDEGTGGGRGGTSARGSTVHSTMAPPPSDRPDMGRAGRLSTMPDRDARPHR